jgi:probable rRNA maturation factor
LVCHPDSGDLAPQARNALAKLAASVLSTHPLDGGQIQAVFTTDEQMARMNEDYRGKNSTTDVLSFDYGASANTDADAGETEWTRGEIYISVERATQQAKERGIATTAEMARLLVHGLLHLAGYDHQTVAELEEMESLTDSFLAASGFEEIR